MEDEKKLYQKFKDFCKINEQFRIAFEKFEKESRTTKLNKNLIYLNYVASELLHVEQFFIQILDHFTEEIPRLLNIFISLNNPPNFSYERHIITTYVLSKILSKRDDLSNFATNYFESTPSPFEKSNKLVSKKRKLTMNRNITDLELVESIYNIVRSNPEFYRNQWNWNTFIKDYMNHKEKTIIWVSCHIVAIIFGMNENKLSKLINSRISNDLALDYSCTFEIEKTLLKNQSSGYTLDQNPIHNTIEGKEKVVNICGIYIPCIAEPQMFEDLLLEVKSTVNNLRKLVVGLASNKGVCLQGPVGCGKTSLIEHLASKTGRVIGQNFVKIQLGDQTDSKMLLGTYRCTDIPGEFIWQPGVLTQAVIEGHWLLLEDIDLASMDIASVLTSLLENRSLTVPGYKDAVPVSPNFQLFVTQRLVTTMSGYHKKHSNAMTLLEKHLLQINISPLTVQDLTEILNTRFPAFKTITQRLINVFMLFSRDSSDNQVITIPKNARLISTRDFFKWCSRAILDFDVSSQASALKVLQDAIDVFCCSYLNIEEALDLAKEISTNLGIINQKAEYFFKLYKPEIRLTTNSLIVGRANMKREIVTHLKQVKFCFTRPSAVLLERIMCCVNLNEPVLLVGETGTGKTSSIQYLSSAIGQKLLVINMNQQSDSADLLGGYKPVDIKFIISPIRQEFEEIFCGYFNIEPNRQYLKNIALCFNKGRWSDLVRLMSASYEAAIKRLRTAIDDSTKQKNNEKLVKEKKFLAQWINIGEKLDKLKIQMKQQHTLAFAFIEGSLVKAVENGYWVLLDEINLANAETLECLSGLLEGSRGSLCLLERGDKEPIKRHPNFTLFACMNPSTDVGKKDLPSGLRNRFTEFYVDELSEKSDLLLLVNHYLEAMSLKENELNKIVDFYLKVRKETIMTLSDGLGHKPHYSLRSLCRALMIAASNPCGVFKRSLFEAVCLGFLSQLDSDSYAIVEKMIIEYILGDQKTMKAILKQPIPLPSDGELYINFEGYWVHRGTLEPCTPEEYILTESVRRNLKDLVRVVSIGKLPVLLQGDTSVGKTSLITYLAKSSGNKCVRINNHEHTDLQEYIGSYVADASGKLIFREGLLVEAMRNGYWIILDELNLAPTDVLEALNRVLDDNRELFIPETQETVKANQNFMLFATQNPPGSYGGRKMLSRAFRNRFVELHFNEIPSHELEFILHRRCQMPPSYAKKMINVMTQLQMRRKGSAAFAGKQGFMTLRDLFRWGERYRLAAKSDKLYDWDQHLADEGYLVLAGRVRKVDEKAEIIEVLEKNLKRTVSPQQLFTLSEKTSSVTKQILEKIELNREKNQHIVWTFNMRQLAVMVAKAMAFKEPVLLVGETGGGKTTVCQLIAENNGQSLLTVNCHMHTESSDFIGGLRPVRDHTEDPNKLFEWVDGPLIKAMVDGNVFLADEISLADDSVLERLNSLLEPERTLLLAEKGIDLNNTANSEVLVAHPNFHFIGTMNPGGDFGKKELSPALRNRFTEIWCDSCTDKNDLILIIEQNVKSGISFGNQQDGSTGIGQSVMNFIEWFQSTEIGKRFTVSIRDILTWIQFINACVDKIDIFEAYLHGACLTFLDSLGSGVTSTENLNNLTKFRKQCEIFLIRQISIFTKNIPKLSTQLSVEISENKFSIQPFYVDKIKTDINVPHFTFNAPTTVFNTLRLIRGMQLNKAILLEGSPGVGKTSLVTALAKYTGHNLFRINLSDQTDISDLFGADLPIEGGVGGQFSWRDGPLLQALKQGDWILLDELNLASQSVLEGLNACLDHRGEVFIPELGKTFHIRPGTKFFACQNPLKQGGSRRGLPKSFLNRFIQVYVNSLTEDDLKHILVNQFTQIPTEIITKMLKFNSKIVYELESYNFGHKGAPWECNLRDLTRWCEVMLYNFESSSAENKKFEPERVVHLIYGDRMRTISDKLNIRQIFEEVFQCKELGDSPAIYVNKSSVYFGDVSILRAVDGINYNMMKQEKTCLVLRSQLSTLRSLAYCVNLNWMCILVGGSGSGKTSVVKTLANLCGKTLKTLPVTSAMDTTDILGGFEQTDYSRHLDEVVRTTEKLLYEAIQDLLITQRTENALELLDIWEEFKKLTNDHQRQTMEEDAKLFIRKINKLETLWNKIEEHSAVSDDLLLLRGKGKKMIELVGREGSLNAGGKFEWVDSILTKCLQDGSWLLIDNVNLCSAAVLDRLNALLEPHGVLTITERGVDSNGKMVQIKPHKDFRLFLTMDPKNGEISRAMRNRGIEICLVNDHEETNQENILDLQSLINIEGLSNPEWINVLIKSHDFISGLILGEKPSINELLQSAFLLSRQIKYGIIDFPETMVDVYYKSRSALEFNCNDADNVIRDEVKKYLRDSHIIEDIDCMHNSNTTLKTNELQYMSDIAKVKQQSSIIQSVISMNYFNDNVNMLKYLLSITFSITSVEDLNLRHLYIHAMLMKNPDLIELANKFNSFFKQLTLSHHNLPVDSKWIPDIKLTSNDYSSGIIVNLHQYLCIQQHSETSESTNKKKTLTIHDYMIERKKKRIEDKFNNVVVNEFLDLVEQFDQYLKEIVHQVPTISEEDLIEIFYLLTWRFLFFRCSLKNIKNVSAHELHDILTNLTVHYQWFNKYSVGKISNIFQRTVPKSLSDITNKINANLEGSAALQHIGKRFQNHNNRPPPLINQHQIEIIPKCNNIIEQYNPYNRRNSTVKVLSILKSDTELLNLLITLKTNLNFEFTDATKEIALLTSLHEKYENQEINKFTDYELELIPLRDYFTVKDLGLVMSGKSNDISKLKSNILVPIELTGILQRFASTGDKRLKHEINRLYISYLLNSTSLKTEKVLKSQKDVKLNMFSPVLTFNYMNLLIGVKNNGSVTTFGNYREVFKRTKILGTTLWSNQYQLSEKKYDFLYATVQYMSNEIRIFFEEFETLLLSANIDIIKQIKVYLLHCQENMLKIANASNLNAKLKLISDIFIEFNYSQAILNSILPLIDPLAKKSLKKKYCLEAMVLFGDIKKAYQLEGRLLTGNDQFHSYNTLIDKLLEKLGAKSDELGKYVAVRPTDSRYETIRKSINHSFKAIFSMEYVDTLLKNLNISITPLLEKRQKIDIDNCKKTLIQYENAIVSYENLLYEWTNYKSGYPDIIEPLLNNVTQFVYGLNLKTALLRKLICEYKNIPIQQSLENFIAMPSLNEYQINYEQQIQTYSNSEFLDFISNTLENVDNPHIVKLEKIRLLKCGIQDTFNNCVIKVQCSNMLEKDVFGSFNNFVDLFVNAWNKQQQEKELKKEESESLYKTKTKCDDKTEEEQIEEELRELFPTHHDDDFIDFQNKNLDEDNTLKKDVTSENLDILTAQDLKFVVNLHKSLVLNFTKSEWLNPLTDKNISSDFVLPLLEKFKLFKQLVEKKIDCLDYTMDNKLIGSMSILLKVVQHYGDSNNLSDHGSPLKLIKKNSYDFYKDPNVDEVKSSYHILEELKLKINQLLDEWPDQPTLKSIITILERIYSFDITSPVSTFLTGFEMLLTKCHEWEEVAHSGVSVSEYTPNLIQQIITWRKLELTMWKDLLNKTNERLCEPISKWWLFLFNVMNQFIVEKEYNTTELIDTLQKFITTSSLAEFNDRLELFLVFHAHSTYLERTLNIEEFSRVLWNLHCYYNQFTTVIQNKIKDLRAPIEKKLKDYVKIVRWKDINYWAIKETVEKSHKTLHKYIREYKDILQQPVYTYLVNTSGNSMENVGIWDRPQRSSPKTYHYTLDVDSYLAKPYLTKKISDSEVNIHEGLLGRIETYFIKSRKLCKDAILGTKYPSLVQNLDGFITDIIERSSQLEKLEVDTSLPKEKQKSHAKNILQQKHRALADLFKQLSKIGLSFRTGIIEQKLKALTTDFTMKPIDLSANFDHIRNHNSINCVRKEEKMLTIWDSCEVYYVKTLMRADILENALKTPAKDLGMQNIERCKGFTSHLMILSQKQKVELIKTSRRYYYLRFYFNQLSNYCDGKDYMQSAKFTKLRNILTNIKIVTSQYKTILNSCPGEEFSDEIYEVPILQTEAKDFITRKNDDSWNIAIGLLNDLQSIATKLLSNMQKICGYVPSVEYDLVYPEYFSLPDISNYTNELSGILEKLNSLVDVFKNVPMTNSISWLITEVQDIKEELINNNFEDNETSASGISEVETLTQSILVIVQNIYKKYQGVTKAQPEESQNQEELEDDHLRSLLIEELHQDFAALEIKKVLKNTHKLASLLFKENPNQTVDLRKAVKQCLPLLEQAILLFQYFITQEISAYRVTCKLNSILLNIFIELASKGFCIPPELSDDMDKEGVSKPSDGLGLGEGEGERDVSDKIESEDQLDDAQPAGQQKEKDEDKDCKEEEKGIEMSEDFDSKLQDKEKGEDDEDQSNSDSDADEQMGDTETGADQLDKEIWGSDKEDEGEGDDQEESETKEEKGNKGQKDGEDQLGANEDKPNKPEDEPDNSEDATDKEKSKKDINELEEPEYGDDQVDPYHGNQPELPEPEPMDLPDDLQLDDGQENDNEQGNEENPFDIDTMKEQNVNDEKEDETADDKQDEDKRIDEVEDFSSDDEDITKIDEENNDKNNDDEPKEENENIEEKQNNDQVDTQDDVKDESENVDVDDEHKEEIPDQTESHEQNVEAMDVDDSQAVDKVQGNNAENQKSDQQIEELFQEDNPDKEGVGQSQMEESETGHSAQTTNSKDTQSMKRNREEEETIQKRKPGESDQQRTLGDTNEQVQKKLKTIEDKNDGGNDDDMETEQNADMYQHIKDAQESSSQVLDAATEEQAEQQQKEVPNDEDDKEVDPATESQTELPTEEKLENETIDSQSQKAEKMDTDKESKSKQRQHPEGDILEDLKDIEVEGEVIQTSTVQRGGETTYNTQFGNVLETTAERLSIEEIQSLRSDVEKQLSSWNEPPSNTEAEQTWQKISSVTSALAQDLSEQLRLVLEPTQASRLKGDFRTGRRINMRKVIPYIASQFRKDKIWLRRTKPSKREYQIVLAVDDSSSMADNKSKEIAFESIALISKALTLLESGQISVLSFGENTEIVHKLSDQFTEKSGVKLLQKFRFDQNKTCIAKLVDFATEMFEQSQMQSSALNAKLLVIVSDGRGVFSEGETFVKQAVRRAKLANIFIVFVVTDNPENNSSILDIRMPVFKDGKLLGIQNYLDVFPFSFYIILRDIKSLPNVLSDALRQWFEVVSNLDKE